MESIFSQITTTNLFLWLCVIWLPTFIGLILNLESKWKKNLLLGVAIPEEAKKEENVSLLLSAFRRNLFLACMIITLAAIPCSLIQRTGTAMTIWSIWILFAIIIPYLPYIQYHQKLKQLKALHGWETTEEDNYWIWGIFYCNPKDNRFFISNRNSMNTTINLAKPSGKIFFSIIIICLLCMPAFGIWLDHMETASVALEIKEETLISSHTGIEYKIPTKDITYIEYVPEKPKIKRSAGTAMGTVQKGRYGTPWGAARICLDPRTSPYIYLETESGKRYLFGSSDATETELVYQQLIHMQHKANQQTSQQTAIK